MGSPHYSPAQKRAFRDTFLRHCRDENRLRAYELTGLEFGVSPDSVEKVIRQFKKGSIDANGVKQVARGVPLSDIPLSPGADQRPAPPPSIRHRSELGYTCLLTE